MTGSACSGVTILFCWSRGLLLPPRDHLPLFQIIRILQARQGLPAGAAGNCLFLDGQQRSSCIGNKQNSKYRLTVYRDEPDNTMNIQCRQPRKVSK